MEAAGISNPVFMQDNSSIHNSYRALIWLQEAGWEVAAALQILILLSMSGATLRGFYTKIFLTLLTYLVDQQLLKREQLNGWQKHGRRFILAY